MIRWFVARRRLVAEIVAKLSDAKPQIFSTRGWQFLYFLVCQFALIGLHAVLFVLELPVHLTLRSTESFTLMARRSPRMEYLESYSAFLRRSQTSVAVVVLSLVAITTQLTFFAYSVWTIGRPIGAAAYVTSIDINPTWDDSTYQDNLWLESNPCQILDTTYLMQGAGDPNMTLGKSANDPVDCDLITDYHTTRHRPGMKFSLAGIPDQATVTGVSLIVNVSNSTTQTATIVHPTSDSLDVLNYADGSVYDAIGGGTVYASPGAWTTTGSKTVALSGSVVNDVQTRLTGSDVIALGIYTSENNNNFGAIDSVNNTTPANRPILRVSYSMPPQAPTNANHGAITTSSIVWTWTDNGTAETRYDVHNASHTPVTGCTNLAANSQSCTETGLSANTQYTRHPNITDAQGNTDGPSASAYTAIQSVSAVSPVSSDSVSITVSASAVSNIGTGLSAVYYEDVTSGQNSGWITTATWTESGLQPNSIYQVRAKSRNGDGVETAFSATASMYTLASSPNVHAARSTSTWYTNGDFTFTNAEPWGAGGIQYYGYLWDKQPTANLDTPLIWSDQVSHCPFPECTVTNPTLSLSATSDGQWYLHVQAYDQTDSALDIANYGPFYFDASQPTAPSTVNDGTGADAAYSTSATVISANWTTSSDAMSGIQKYQYAIGTTAGGTDVLTYTDNGVTTSVTRTGLSLVNGGTYYFSVRAVDNAGNIGVAQSSNGIIIDASGPTFSAITSSSTPSSFQVSWTSSEASTDQIEYGLTTSYGSTTSIESSARTTHSASVTGVASNTIFHFRVKGIDTLGNTSYSLDQQVSTSSSPMTLISNVLATVQSPTSVLISWTTNEPATSKVRYGTSTAYGLEVFDASLVTSHSIVVNNLTANTTYHYEVISVGSTTDQDADATFTTTGTDTGTPTPTAATVATPTITNIKDGDLFADPTPTIAGTGPVGAGIFIVVDRKLVRTVPVDSRGQFLVELLTPLSEGSHAFVVRAKVAPGEVSEESTPIVATLVKPAAGATITSRTIHDGTQPSVTFGVVAPGNSVVKVYIDATEVQSIPTPDVRPSAYGFYTTVTPDASLAVGKHTISFVTYFRGIRPSLPTGQTVFTKTGSGDATGSELRYGTATNYTVQSGDSLWSIAQRYLGDGNRWTEIQSINVTMHPSLSSTPGILSTGWTIVLPAI